VEFEDLHKTMKEYKYKINGNSYKVINGNSYKEDNIAHVEVNGTHYKVNGTHYKVEMEKQPKAAPAKPVVRPLPNSPAAPTTPVVKPYRSLLHERYCLRYLQWSLYMSYR